MTNSIFKKLGSIFTNASNRDNFRVESPLFDKLSKYASRGRALDVGCGRGWFMSKLRAEGYEVTGIDINEVRVSEASKWGSVIIANADKLPFQDKFFNLVSCLDVFHHMSNPWQTLAEIERVLTDEGIFYIGEVVEDNPVHAFLRKAFPYYDGDPVRAKFKKSQLIKRLEDNGFTVLVETTQGGNIYWIFILLVNRFNFLGRLSPMVIALDKQIDRVTGKYSCYYYAIACKKETAGLINQAKTSP